MGGVGEFLEPAPALPTCGIILVNPGVALATAAVFRVRRGAWSVRTELPASWRDAHAMAEDMRLYRNDLQPAAIALCPVIGDVLTVLESTPGCLLARMSGSGATCFGLYVDRDAAIRAASGVRQPGWWIWGGSLRQG